MPFVRSFFGFAPPARFDDLPFTEALVFEAADDTGAYELRDAIDLAALPGGLDVDPAAPALRDLTTAAAQLDPPAYFRIDWRDAGGATFKGGAFRYAEPGPAFLTAADVREESDVAFGGRYAAPEPGDPDPLEGRVRAAQGYVERVTGRKLDESLPAQLVELARDAVIMRVEQMLGQRSRASVKAATFGPALKAMRAGDYSETRADPDAQIKGRLVNPWPALSELLWLLATPARRDELLAELTGAVPPAAVAVEVADDYFTADDVYRYW